MTKSRRGRRLATVAAVAAGLAVSSLLAGCGERSQFRDEVLAAIDATERSPARYIYSDLRKDRKVVVQGVLEDDFRFKARVSLDGEPYYDEVVYDDALAVRLLQPGALEFLTDIEKAGRADKATELQGFSADAVLRSRRWVLDATGAPPQTAGGRPDSEIGGDPVLDALTVLDYVRAAVEATGAVERFERDDLSPTYSPSEDDFPKPPEGSGIDRFDLRRPRLPTPQGATASGNVQAPQTSHFRKMAIYVQDGRVIQVIEKVEVTGRFVGDVVRNVRAVLREFDAPGQVREEFERVVDSTPEARLGPLLLEGINGQLKAVGQQPVLARTMSLDLRDIGRSNAVRLPTLNVVKGSLDMLVSSGRPATEETSTSGTGT